MKAVVVIAFVMVVGAHTVCAQAPHVVGAMQLTASTLLSDVHVESDPSDDRIYVYGSFNGTIYIDGDSLVSRGQSDGFIVCLDLQMNKRWMLNVGGPGSDVIADLKVVPNDGVIAAMSCGGNTASITTYTIGSITFSGRGNTDVATAWFGRDGDVKWVRNDGAESYEGPSKLHRFTDGTIAVIGSFSTRSRFGSTEIVCGSSVNGGFVQMLTSNGEHVSVAHTISVPGSSPDDADGSLLFQDLTDLSDSTFGIVANGVGKNTIGGRSVSLGNVPRSGYGLIILDRTGKARETSDWTTCTGPWWMLESEGGAEGISSFDWRCTPKNGFNVVWHVVRSARRDTIMRALSRNVDEFLVTFNGTSRFDQRSLIFGDFADTLDLLQTTQFPDAVSGSGANVHQAFVLISDDVGAFRRILHIPSDLRGTATSACYTAVGLAVAVKTAGTITLPDTSLPGVVNGVTVVGFRERGTGIGEWGMGNGEWGIGNGEWGVVFTALGGMVAQGSITREVLGALAPGVYVIQSGGRLSLCHVLSADNIAFAVPAAASRKGP